MLQIQASLRKNLYTEKTAARETYKQHIHEIQAPALNIYEPNKSQTITRLKLPVTI